MRALTLHISALNDSEYGSYTDALNDLTADANSGLASDEHYNSISVGVREVRAWLRGRYSTLPILDIDAILKFFSPNLSQTDVLNGGQFFAVMRLVTHARHGKGIDKSFAFMQAHPDFQSPSPTNTIKPPPPPPPPPPARRFSQVTAFSEPTDNNPFHAVARAKHQLPSKPPIHPGTTALVSSLAPAVPHKSTNPFISRSKSDGRTHAPGESLQPKLPPLPPRKPSFLIAASQQPALTSNPIGKTAKPTHAVSPLIGRSLEASRVAHSRRKAEESLEQERVMQVLKSSSGNGSSSSLRNNSISPTKMTGGSNSSSDGKQSSSLSKLPVLPPRRNRVSPPASVADSTKSFEQVAKASLSTYAFVHSPAVSSFSSRSPERGRARPSPIDDHPRASSSSPTRPPPPTHPDRKPPPISTADAQSSEISPSLLYPISPTSPRIFRSKSMHHPKTPPPPPARAPRERPKTEQFSPASATFNLDQDRQPPQGFSGLTRHISLSSTHGRSSSTDGSPSAVKKNIQKTLSSFQPKLDAARYKAEAGLSRRGYLNHTIVGGHNTSPAFKNWAEEGERSLIDDDDDSVTVDGSSSFSFDDDADGSSSRRPHSGRSRVDSDRDGMKWPVGEGWKPL